MKENRLLDLKSFFLQKKEARSIGDDFYVTEIRKGAMASFPIKSDMYVCSLGVSGQSGGQINLFPYTFKPRSMCITLPGYVLEPEGGSDNFRCLCVLMSESFFSGLGISYDFGTLAAIQDNPVLDLTERQYAAALKYYDMAYSVLGSRNPYKREIIKHLSCAFFYGLGYFFYENACGRELSNEETLTQRFVKEVRRFYKRERKVLFYAERLHLSTGYLSTVVRKVSGRTASEWIDDYVILEAKSLLKSTNLTVQQVSDSLSFPSQSFFGKWFKRRTGLSPKAYRRQ